MNAITLWKVVQFSQLTAIQLYQLIKLRSDIFVVEQNCIYSELDDKDHQTGVLHLLGYKGEELIACARLLPAGVSFPSVSIGRVAIKKNMRKKGLGHILMDQALMCCEEHWPQKNIEISAQEYLNKFYLQYNFINTSAVYIDDGIPHIDMILKKSLL
ncbi:UNVERIFIED_CONTAM: hypothetical protein GTU68_056396 [Idotea baltica]|nr:hypothetical protein [Idotea baltica]